MPIRLGAALARCAVMALALEQFFAASVLGFSGIPPSAGIQRPRGVVAVVGAQSSSVAVLPGVAQVKMTPPTGAVPPHSPSSQPCLVPVRPRRSRRTSRSV